MLVKNSVQVSLHVEPQDVDLDFQFSHSDKELSWKHFMDFGFIFYYHLLRDKYTFQTAIAKVFSERKGRCWYIKLYLETRMSYMAMYLVRSLLVEQRQH